MTFISAFLLNKKSSSTINTFCLKILVIAALANDGFVFSTEPMNFNSDLYEGDISIQTVKPNPQILRNAIKENSSYKWPSGLIPYELDLKNLEVSGLSVLFEVFEELQRETCLMFREKLPHDTNFLFVTNSGGCWSFVGRQIERLDGQELSLGPLCWEKATVAHEVMHSLGFFHEHSRYDRDDFIEINLTNVEKKHWNQFDKRSPDETDLLGDYDYISILHYHAHAWAKDKSIATIKAKKPTSQIGQAKTYSKMDIEKINTLYQCTDKLIIDNSVAGDAVISVVTVIPPPLLPVPSQPQCDTFQFCSDLDPLCPALAEQGWCEMMPGKMLFECRRSCCNCYNTRCHDTNVEFYWKNFCYSSSYFDGFKHQTIFYPSTCFSVYTKQMAYDFCPKMCNRC